MKSGLIGSFFDRSGHRSRNAGAGIHHALSGSLGTLGQASGIRTVVPVTRTCPKAIGFAEDKTMLISFCLALPCFTAR